MEIRMKKIEYLDNYPTRYFVDEEGRVWYNANDCARAKSFVDLEDLLGSDLGLDLILEWNKLYPTYPFFGGFLRYVNEGNEQVPYFVQYKNQIK